jgi:glucoamylase
MNDGFFSPASAEVAGTVATLNELFCREYDVNRADTAAGVPGILYGRYENDKYAGGNPWILLSAALAETLYRGASEAKAAAAAEAMATVAVPATAVEGGARLAEGALEAWAPVLGLDAATAGAAELAEALAGAGDGVMVRIRTHVAGAGFHLAEQLDRGTGNPMSAADLTWSYATVLKAVHARAQYHGVQQGNATAAL